MTLENVRVFVWKTISENMHGRMCSDAPNEVHLSPFHIDFRRRTDFGDLDLHSTAQAKCRRMQTESTSNQSNNRISIISLPVGVRHCNRNRHTTNYDTENGKIFRTIIVHFFGARMILNRKTKEQAKRYEMIIKARKQSKRRSEAKASRR